MNDEAEDDFGGIPDMPSTEEVRADILRTSGPLSWRPFGNRDGSRPSGEPLDPSAHEPKLVDRAIEARLLVGPGEHANSYQRALFAHHNELAKLESERDFLLSLVTEVRFDPQTGEAIPTRTAEERERLSVLAGGIQSKLDLKNGAPGLDALAAKLDQAVRERREAIARAYMLKEAKRRAAAADVEAEIDRQAQLLRKGGGAK